MHGLTGHTLAVAALCMSAFVPSSVSARDDGRYANSPLHAWFDQLASGRGLCCSFADGLSIQDVDWDMQNGRYRVRLHGEWIFVPDAAVVAEPNRFGPAVVWPYMDADGATQDSLLLAWCGRLESVPPRNDSGRQDCHHLNLPETNSAVVEKKAMRYFAILKAALSGVGNSDRHKSVSEKSKWSIHSLACPIYGGFVMRNSSGGVRPAREQRLQIMLSDEELKAVDNFRSEHRMPTRAAAVRELLRHGIAAWVETGLQQLV